MKLDGLEIPELECMGNGAYSDPAATKQAVFEEMKKAGWTDLDALILANQDAEMRKLVLLTPKDDPELLLWWEQKRGDPFYTMSKEDFDKYVASQRSLSAAQSGAGMGPEARAEIMRRVEGGAGIPLWVWLAGGGLVAFLVFRRS